MLCKVNGSSYIYTRFTFNRKRILRSTGTKDKRLAQEYEDKLKERFWRAKRLGQVERTWEELVLAYSLGKLVDPWHLSLLDKHCAGKTEFGEVRDAFVKERLEDVSNSTINRTLEVFRAVLKNGERKGWMVAPYVELLPEPKDRVRYLTREEANRLLSELPEHLGEMVRFGLSTGLREANITGLTWNRVDLTRRLAWVESSDVKNKEAHQVPLNAEAILVLRRQSGKHERWVFTYRGERVKGINNHAWRKALRRSEIDDFRVHDLRHTWASWHIQAGTPIPVLQKLGGWKTLSMVMRYAHLGQSHIAGHADNICRLAVKELAKGDLVNSAKSQETA